jgi:uncharacterized OsmC-like protein
MTTRAKSFSYGVSLDDEWNARSDRGGAPIVDDEQAWTPEHLVLAGLCRCTLTSFRHHARRAGLEPVSRAVANGVVSRREEDGRFAFVEIRVDLEVTFPEPLSDEDVRGLIAKGERDCFVGASLTTPPIYTWTANGEDLS